jgi:hypothetical protein
VKKTFCAFLKKTFSNRKSPQNSAFFYAHYEYFTKKFVCSYWNVFQTLNANAHEMAQKTPFL